MDTFDFNYAIKLYNDEEYSKFIEYCKPFDNIENGEVLTDLGICHRDGLSVEKDFEKAISLFEKAISLGYIPANGSLGVLYRTKGEFYNLEKAIHYYNIAAKNGISSAMYNLGKIYRNEESVKDNEKALYWYELAAEKGDSDAMYYAGYIYKYDLNNIERAIYWYELAAEKGDSDAMYALGNTYKNFDDVKDFEKAKKWYKLSAQNNNADGKYYFASLTFKTQDESNYPDAYNYLIDLALNDSADALKLLNKQVDTNSPMAMFFMGRYYTEKNDNDTALIYYKKAALQGYIPAQNILLINNSTYTAKTVDKIKSETAVIMETSKTNSTKLDNISANILSLNDKLKEIRDSAFSGNVETEDEEISVAIQKSAEVVNNVVLQKPADKIKMQKDILIKIFGEKIWNRLMPESQTSLISSAVLLKDCEGMPADFDYTGICITAIVALEQELKQIFSENYLAYLKQNKKEIPYIFTENNYFFSLGKLDKLFGFNKKTKTIKHDFNTRSISAYLAEIVNPKFAQSPIYAFMQNNNDDCIIARCLAINEKYRCKAAHKGNISYIDAVDCCYEIYGESKAQTDAKQNTAEVINILRELFTILK